MHGGAEAGRRQGAPAGIWRSASRNGSYRALPGYAHVDADRLTTSRDAEERRRTRGPWMDGMVFGAAGHTAARPRRKGGARSFAVMILICACARFRFRFEFVFQGPADMALPDTIPRRGHGPRRPPVSLFALALTGYGPLRRRILGTVVTKNEQK